MNSQQFFWLLRRKLSLMVLFGLLFSALGFFGLMVFTKPFQAKTDFLVVQANTQNQDFYTQFKSSEYLGNVLSEAIYSERFIDAVVETGKVNNEFLPFDKKDKLDTWRKMVDVQKNLELGIITVTIKSGTERDASRIMGGVSQVLTERNNLFRGGDEKSVEIRILSGPIIERNPSMTKIATIVGGGFATGFLFTASLVLLMGEVHVRKRKAGLSGTMNFHKAFAE